tara:strand:- start:360 stop:962 length:603 start_codon:yes stop_codon:yes gene_type:complete
MSQFSDPSNTFRQIAEFAIENPYVLLPFVFFIFIKFLIYARRKRIRRFMQRRADEVLKQLRALDIKADGAKMFGLLRAMPPFAFEEMILTALSDRGFKIKRNRWYMGDGGLDGQFWIGGQRVLIQAKRYKNHIEHLHVEDFARLCARRKCKGVFVHTGRTGKKSKEEADAHPHIEIISGQAMLNLFAGRRVVLFGQEYFN